MYVNDLSLMVTTHTLAMKLIMYLFSECFLLFSFCHGMVIHGSEIALLQTLDDMICAQHLQASHMPRDAGHIYLVMLPGTGYLFNWSAGLRP